MSKTMSFFREVRQEVAKVTWPTAREVRISTLIVFGGVVVMSLFFFLSDQIIQLLLSLILGIGV